MMERELKCVNKACTLPGEYWILLSIDLLKDIHFKKACLFLH